MSFVYDLLTQIGGMLRPYNNDIALALVASLLVITGGDINRYLKRQISSANFVVRTTIFIFVCTFGYGALTVLLTNILKTQLAALSSMYLAITVIGCFIALGVYAERKRQI
ncbi:DUF3392 domain-containing protein [Psychrosphaera sp. F3M07]|jgi:uncharacterized membrane protein|uniref:DUF3392 domain-containing protein n=1 Tax=Psychrosphaera sp. F3M07 TaxID=2841560 RepID=UPI001C0A08E9|nr:DUF3392 domain-containing protein [Psychrosphaera sp. F3M07]MBU2917518.1 DUF3392 domain-containing protein [Psychrosphaera sp. F3M07]